MERRLAAILAADVQGYSRLTELNEEASTATLRNYRAVVEELSAAHRGKIFSSAGDGMVAEFPSIVEAIRCAVEIQSEIAERNASVPKEGQMWFRIGVNLGDVIAAEDNVYGTGVNVAARTRATGRAWRNLHFANRLRASPQDRRDSIPGHRRAPFEEHHRADSGLSHPAGALAVAQEADVSRASPPKRGCRRHSSFAGRCGGGILLSASACRAVDGSARR